MPDKNIQIKDQDGNNLYPKTKANLVVNDDGDNLETLLSKKIDNQSPTIYSPNLAEPSIRGANGTTQFHYPRRIEVGTDYVNIKGYGYAASTGTELRIEGETVALKSDIPDMANFYTKTEVDSNFYDKAEVEDKIAEAVTGSEIDLSEYAKVEDVETALDTKQDKGNYALKSDIPDTSNFATKSELVNGLQEKANSSDIPTKTSQLTNDNNYIINQANSHENSIAIESHQHSVYTVTIGVDSITHRPYSCAIGNNAHAIHDGSIAIGSFSGASEDNNIAIGYTANANAENSIQIGTGNNYTENSLQVKEYTLLDLSTGSIPDERLSNNIARTTDIPDVSNLATKEELNNKQDKGDYALKSDIPTDYLTEQQLEEKNYVDTDRFLFGLETKQDVLVAGENITIEGNTISATVGSTGGSVGGLPIGTMYSLNCTENYVPEGSLLCDGAEYSKEQFNDFWNNYLKNEAETVINENILNTNNNIMKNGVISNFNSPVSFNFDTNTRSASIGIKTGEDVTTMQFVCSNGSTVIWIQDGIFFSNNGGITTALPNTEYSFDLNVENSFIRIEDEEVTDVDLITNNIEFGVGSYDGLDYFGKFLGEIVLTTGIYGYITTEATDNTYYTETIYTSKLNTCTYDEYSEVLDTYGFCDKFAVDTTNETFKVPTTKQIERYLIKKKESTAEDLTWYNIYSDGYCEQGGYMTPAGTSATLTYTLSFKENEVPYVEVNEATTDSSSDTGGYDAVSAVANITNVSCRLTTIKGRTLYWRAIGYINLETYPLPRNFVVVANGSINQSQMDWSAWASGLNGKANIDLSNSSVPHIVEVSDKSLMPSWYRVYSDGWCEQGGEFVSTGNVAFLKEYASANYTININYLENTSTSSITVTHLAPRRTTTGFTVASSSYKKSWKTSGYIS